MTPTLPRRSAARRLALGIQLLALALLLAPTVGGAQARKLTARTSDATRAELTRLLDSLQRVSPTSGSKKERAARTSAIAEVKERLTDGDFHTGDRFYVTNLAAPDPRAAGDSVIVRDSLNINIGNWPTVSLHGVLRSELQPFIQRYAATYVREPRIQVQPLTRVSVIGGVARPGFYEINPDRPLGELITNMGLSSQTKPDKITVYRGGDKVMNEKQVASALQEGLTVDEAGLESGDQIRVEQQKQRNWSPNLQLILFGLTALSAVLALVRSSYVD